MPENAASRNPSGEEPPHRLPGAGQPRTAFLPRIRTPGSGIPVPPAEGNRDDSLLAESIDRPRGGHLIAENWRCYEVLSAAACCPWPPGTPWHTSLSAGQVLAGEVFESALALPDHHICLISLVGLVTFYGLEKVVQPGRSGGTERDVHAGVSWVHSASFTFCNAHSGYLPVHRVDP